MPRPEPPQHTHLHVDMLLKDETTCRINCFRAFARAAARPLTAAAWSGEWRSRNLLGWAGCRHNEAQAPGLEDPRHPRGAIADLVVDSVAVLAGRGRAA